MSLTATATAIGATRADAGSGTATAVTTGAAIAAPYSVAITTVFPVSVVTLTTVFSTSGIAACCKNSALTHQNERTALGKFDACTGTCPAGCITALGFERNILGYMDKYRSAIGNGQSTSACSVGERQIFSDIIGS